jgi:hypothetical protein
MGDGMSRATQMEFMIGQISGERRTMRSFGLSACMSLVLILSGPAAAQTTQDHPPGHVGDGTLGASLTIVGAATLTGYANAQQQTVQLAGATCTTPVLRQYSDRRANLA